MQVGPACFCGLPEDLLNLFTTCHFAQVIFDWFLVQLHRFRPSRNFISASEILFGFLVDSSLPVVYLVSYNIIFGLLAIWLTVSRMFLPMPL